MDEGLFTGTISWTSKEGERRRTEKKEKEKRRREGYRKHDKLYITLGATAAVSEAKAIGKSEGFDLAYSIYEGCNSGQMKLPTHIIEEERL